MEGRESWKLSRAHSCPIRSPILMRYSSVHNLQASMESFESDDDSEEMKLHSPTSSFFTSFIAGHHLSLLPILLILFLLLLSFIYLRPQSPFLWKLSLASAAVAAASLVLKRSRLSDFLRFRFGRRKHVRWFIGDDDDGDTENPRDDEKPASGEGVQFYRNGRDFYEGEFYKGKCSGSGVYYFGRQGKYEGDWVDGKYDGYGIESWASGSRYQGHYHRGLKHGIGVYKLNNGDSYAGEWFAGRSHGRGVHGCADGSCFMGEFKCGAKHGLGYYHFGNEDRYVGQYFANKIQGFGVYYFANGDYYEGSWHEGRQQGFGSYTFESGEAMAGEWDSGALKNTLPLADPNVKRAVQSAQRALERTLLLPSIEERVEKAVASAEKAAECARIASVKAVQACY
ncbi:hypothetical protein KSP39_PZI010293 [Platanthera zijinensis]|uniref:Uncharacterized protein n=1 Tax=Platanthera zijinensis TaxID=2320716 RepID=A0AAP0BKU4_9ASPA